MAEKLYNFKTFHSYMKQKANESRKGDYDGPLAIKPKENGDYPDQPKSIDHYKKMPYAGKGQDPGLESADTDEKPGLGSVPAPNMKPKDAAPLGVNPGKPAKHVPPQKKLKEFFDATAGMNDSEFVEYLLERSYVRPRTAMVHDLHGKPFTPHPHETMQYVCSLLHNPDMVSRLIQEVKKSGQLESVVRELLDQQEFHDEVVKALDDDEEGPGHAHRMAKSMFNHYNDFKDKAGLMDESVAPALLDNDDEDEDDDWRNEADKDQPPEVIPGGGQAPEMPEPPEQGGPKLKKHRRAKEHPHQRLTKALYSHFGEEIPRMCADGSC